MKMEKMLCSHFVLFQWALPEIPSAIISSFSFSVILCWSGFGFHFLEFYESGVGKLGLQAKSGLTKNNFHILLKYS